MGARVMVMAGGTGGHVFPALAVAEELRRRGCEVRWMGVPDSFEARVVPQHDFPMDWVQARRLRGQGVGGLLLAPLQLLRSMVQAWGALRRFRAQVVLGMGGFVTAPGGLVSRLLGMPLVIHEQNAIPGMSNQWLARIATRVLCAFPDTFSAARAAEVVGNPVRPEIAALAGRPRYPRDAGEGCHLLVLGGSLGAAALNEKLPEALSMLEPALRPLVRHQAGRDKVSATQRAYEAAGVEAQVTDFLNDMAEAYAWADLVVCRSGAITVAELAAAGVAAVLVPYPHAVDDHQSANARFLVQAGAARMLPQREMSGQNLAELLRELCAAPQTMRDMADRAGELARAGATERVADVCLEVAR